MFRKTYLFPSSGKGIVTPTLLGTLERANLDQFIKAVIPNKFFNFPKMTENAKSLHDT
jgi:hypothetical protein